MPAWLSLSLLFWAAIYCLARAVVDLRSRRYWWAAAALLSLVGILTVPVQTHAVKIDLPRR